jgi:hypothetical protein
MPAQRITEFRYGPSMNFVIYYTFPPFIKSLKAGCTVYVTVYKETPKGSPVPNPVTFNRILLTSDAGIDGGTLHVLQILITADESNQTYLDSKGDPGSEAYDIIVEFLEKRDIKVSEGILLTAGLQDALSFWGRSGDYSLAEIAELRKVGNTVRK